MPTAGDEGYEKLIQCPYDKAHEIRKGRMQFHLQKCRENFPTSQKVTCPYDRMHIVPKQELQYHLDEECDKTMVWERYTHVSESNCPVKDLVPVNVATVPDGDENWDNFEATGSVLNHIKAEAEQKPIIRMCQVKSKAQRKAFRQQERNRHSALAQGENHANITPSDTDSIVSSQQPLPKPSTRSVHVPQIKQDPNKAVAAINKQFRTLDLNLKEAVVPSETSSMVGGPPSEYPASEVETASTSRQSGFNYAAAAHPGLAGRRPQSSASSLSGANSSTSMMTTLTSQNFPGRRPTSAMSSASSSYATASQSNRPSSVISDTSVGNGTMSSVSTYTNHRPPNSTTYRQSTAMNIAASVGHVNDEDGFCQLPIPGLGRGRRSRNQPQ